MEVKSGGLARLWFTVWIRMRSSLLFQGEKWRETEQAEGVSPWGHSQI